MDHSQFIRLVTDAELITGNVYYFTDEIIRRWLQDNTWVEEASAPCVWCKHMVEISSGFSAERCRLKVAQGSSCYRQTLRDFFIPFLRNALQGIYPSLSDLKKPVHLKGEIWDGFDNMTLMGIVCHELGGTTMRMHAEVARQIQTRK